MTEDQHAPLSEAALLDIVSEIVASYVSNNSVRSGDLAEIIASVHTTLATLAVGGAAPVVAVPLDPAVPIKKSVTPDFLICLEDGKKFKSLRRHLRTAYDLSPDQYRAKWNLPREYPMVAPAYAAARSELAKQSGLGQQARLAPVSEPAAPARGRGRPKKEA